MPQPVPAPLDDRSDLTIIHPMDPWKQGIGGFDTCIDGVLRYAPADWTIEFIGLTAEPEERPVGRWIDLPFDGRRIRFFPVMAERDPSVVRRVPLVLRFALACRLRRAAPTGKVVQIHRFESAIGVRLSPRQRAVYFFHNHPEEVASPYSDVRWRRMGWLFYRLMARKMRGAAAVVAVDSRTPAWLVSRFPWLDGVAALLPEWADPRIFSPGSPQDRHAAADNLRLRHRLEPETKVVAFVGRIERQKDPLLMVQAFTELIRFEPKAVLMVLGEGRMLGALREEAESRDLRGKVHFLAPVERSDLVEFYRACDVLACTSGFEAGPRVVFEALASGTPVVSFDVGQVPKVLGPGTPEEIGALVEARDSREFAWALASVLSVPTSAGRAVRCAAAVKTFTPKRALAGLFDLYGRWIHRG